MSTVKAAWKRLEWAKSGRQRSRWAVASGLRGLIGGRAFAVPPRSRPAQGKLHGKNKPRNQWLRG